MLSKRKLWQVVSILYPNYIGSGENITHGSKLPILVFILAQGAGPLYGIMLQLQGAENLMLPYHQAVSMLKHVIDKAISGTCSLWDLNVVLCRDLIFIYRI